MCWLTLISNKLMNYIIVTGVEDLFERDAINVVKNTTNTIDTK